MPLEFAAELVLRFLIESMVYALGYATGWLLVPGLSFGYYSVEPLPPPRRGVRRGRARGDRHPRQLSAEATAVVGILFWMAVLATGIGVWWLTRPG